MLRALAASSSACFASPILDSSSSSISKPFFSLSKPFLSLSKPSPFPRNTRRFSFYKAPMNILNKLGFGTKSSDPSATDSSIPQGPDDDVPAPGQQFAQFGAGCFWGVELAFQRVSGVTKTEVGYSQGILHNPTYEDVCTGTTGHNEVVRVQYDPKAGSYESLLDAFWARHDPTTLNRQMHHFVYRKPLKLELSKRPEGVGLEGIVFSQYVLTLANLKLLGTLMTLAHLSAEAVVFFSLKPSYCF
ncbi:peptide methionine sulfoxide reductase-like isoform X2 [Tripterygium wilfordii]|uniref:peptide methionine sulfoxide reductase-like isoform X2 n=1 Tax=Tripterygium wilfordii TaxID=458696 RepID=UPI0018F83FBA|nr:peptide methionine sulfoxide reductase-like isoform X2 [Tripterygium wilfordii]